MEDMLSKCQEDLITPVQLSKPENRETEPSLKPGSLHRAEYSPPGHSLSTIRRIEREDQSDICCLWITDMKSQEMKIVF